jgi:multiple antibiotic resistance protein
MIVRMESLNLADTFVTFLALLGPQKVLLSFARLGRALDVRSMRRVAWACSLAAACVGVLCALTAPWLASFFHISNASLGLAAGLTFFIYSVGLVLGLHFDALVVPESDMDGPDASHPILSGFREMLLPFVVSPLAVAADLLESLTAHGWAGRWAVAGAFVTVAGIDLVCAWLFAPLLRRTHELVLEVLSRLLGILLAAVGVQLFLQGLAALGVMPGKGGH